MDYQPVSDKCQGLTKPGRDIDLRGTFQEGSLKKQGKWRTMRSWDLWEFAMGITLCVFLSLFGICIGKQDLGRVTLFGHVAVDYWVFKGPLPLPNILFSLYQTQQVLENNFKYILKFSISIFNTTSTIMSGIIHKVENALHLNKNHGTATTGTTHTTHNNGVPEGTAGPHSSRVANAADPRVDSGKHLLISNHIVIANCHSRPRFFKSWLRNNWHNPHYT
jgi:hypothetical protein